MMEDNKTTIKISDLLVKFSHYIVWAARILLLFDVILIGFAFALGVPMAWMTTSMVISLVVGALLWAPVILRFIKKAKNYRVEW